MALRDRAKEAMSSAMQAGREQVAHRQEAKAVAAQQVSSVTSGCPGNHYVTEVNKGSINMRSWASHLNDMYAKGYRLHQVFMQDGNTVQVFEHHFHG
jgi:hypothetical protein